jgi:hypothetical protein
LFAEICLLTLPFLLAAFPAGSPLLANGTVDVVVIGAGLTHGFEAPVSRRGSHQISMFLMKVAKSGIGRFAAKGCAMKLHKGSRHIESP